MHRINLWVYGGFSVCKVLCVWEWVQKRDLELSGRQSFPSKKWSARKNLLLLHQQQQLAQRKGSAKMGLRKPPHRKSSTTTINWFRGQLKVQLLPTIFFARERRHTFWQMKEEITKYSVLFCAFGGCCSSSFKGPVLSSYPTSHTHCFMWVIHSSWAPSNCWPEWRSSD